MGYILLLLAVALYFKKEFKVYSIILFFAFVLSGFRILPETLLGAKLTHMALAYVVIISLINAMNIKGYFIKGFLAKPIWFFLLFIFISSLYSILYYNFPVLDVFITALRYYVILAYFFLIRLSFDECKKIIRIFFVVTIITSILYIIQTITGIQLLSYSYDVFESADPTSGLYRFYNSPPLLVLFLLLSFFYPSLFSKKELIVSRIVFSVTLLSSMGRTSMVCITIAILIGFMMTGSLTKHYKKIIIIAIVLIPFYSIISQRFSSGGTSNDINLIMSGNYYAADENGGGRGATMAYRVAWIMERWEYLMKRPISESVFGLGLLPDEHLDVRKKYRFNYGLYNEEDGYVTQMRTPDSAWGNFLTCFGILGTVFWLILCISFIKFFYKNRTNIVGLVCFLALLYYSLGSIAGSYLSEPYSILIYFLFLPMIKRTDLINDAN